MPNNGIGGSNMQAAKLTTTQPLDSFDLAPPLPARPIQWRRAKQLLRELIAKPEATDKVFELFAAMGGKGDEASVQRFAAHPEGRRLFAEKPSLLELLGDRARLQALPEESFARAYLAFSERNGFSTDGLLKSNEVGFGETNALLDPDRRWFFERVNLMHDLWHVLTGYDTDVAGEAALLAFSTGQGLANRSIGLLLLTAMARAPKSQGFAFQRFVLRAMHHGRRAAPLLSQHYEELLPRPLAEVRGELGILPIRDAHPGGLFRAGPNLRGIVRVAA
jgi:ubiquinone biosynthesis protein COQ4